MKSTTYDQHGNPISGDTNLPRTYNDTPSLIDQLMSRRARERALMIVDAQLKDDQHQIDTRLEYRCAEREVYLKLKLAKIENDEKEALTAIKAAGNRALFKHMAQAQADLLKQLEHINSDPNSPDSMKEELIEIAYELFREYKLEIKALYRGNKGSF